jgi:SAM-dependent methyltransferase
MIFEYKGQAYPEYLRHGGARLYIDQVAEHFCRGRGLDIGAGQCPLRGAIAVDVDGDQDAMCLRDHKYDYIFSSHCLEHLTDPIGALEHWKSRLRHGGVLFLYLPHPDMAYWLPQNNRKHLHSWYPFQMRDIIKDLGFVNVMNSERDMYWSFSVVGFNG